MQLVGRIDLVGAGGEPVDFRRTLASHGVAMLAPQRLNTETWTLETTMALPGGVQSIRIRQQQPDLAVVETAERRPGPAMCQQLTDAARFLLRLDEDLSPFYVLAKADESMGWVISGAGRMLRSLTVFEDVVKTICTTNCSWSATVRMTNALVNSLGEPCRDGRRAFPTPAAMAAAGNDFYVHVARAGYRGDYLLRIATGVAEGRLDLEQLRDPALDDAEVERRLLALPGVGPYAAAHVMLTSLGRYRRLVLDSWTRPTYANLVGRLTSDLAIERRFRRYRQYGGLAFWLFLTKGWLDDEPDDESP
ncbi:MAG: DNA-3-methyladenine glycosylase family protein [Acidimicrobiales bacterium]